MIYCEIRKCLKMGVTTAYLGWMPLVWIARPPQASKEIQISHSTSHCFLQTNRQCYWLLRNLDQQRTNLSVDTSDIETHLSPAAA